MGTEASITSDAGDAIPQARIYTFANAEWNEATGTLSVDGLPVKVEPRPLRLLAELLRRPDEVLTSDELQTLVWDDRPTVAHVLSSAVNRLRKALGDAAAAHVVTVPRMGYKFAGPVRVQRLQASSVLRPSLQAGLPVPGREAFLLVRPLGDDPGRATVWLGQHAKLGWQHVFKFADSAGRLASLRREMNFYRLLRQELGARRDFAVVVDCNFTTAPYFLECEWGGHDLGAWAAEGQALAALGVDQRIALFLQAAEALAAAHRVGVLHKDIKPGNILVEADAEAQGTGGWQLRLADLGSGRLLDPDSLRALKGTLLELSQTAGVNQPLTGTALYLAPELLAGQPASEQSDLYALGLVLYQMVAGDLTRPLAGGWERDIADPLLREDIAAATDGNPAQRLRHVSELVDRLRTLPQRRQASALAAQELAARVASEAELLRVRARRPLMLALVASLALGLALSLWLGQQTRRALAVAQAESARAVAINTFMQDDLLGGLGTSRVGEGATVSMREVLDRAATRVAQRFSAQPVVQAEVRGQLANLNYKLSEFEAAESEFGKAVGLLQTALPAQDARALQLRYERVRNAAAHNKLREAATWLEAADRDAAGQLDAPSVLALTAAAARTGVLTSQGKAAEALPVAQRVVVLADTLPDAGSARFTSRLVVGDLLYRLGRFADAEAVLAQALPATVNVRELGEVPVARGHVVQGRVLLELGRTAEAESTLLQARDVLMQRVGPGEQYVNVADAALASMYDARGDFDKARHAYQTVYDRYVKAQGAEHPNSRVMALNLAISELNLGRAAAALRRLDDGRAWFAQYMGGDKGPVVQAVDFERARALTTLGRAPQALQVLESLDAQTLTQAAPAKDWAWRLQAERGRAHLASGHRAEGLQLLRAALPELAATGSAPWVQAGYKALAGPLDATGKGR